MFLRSLLLAAVSVSAATVLALSAPGASAAVCGGGIGDTDNFTTSIDCADPPDGRGGNVKVAQMNEGSGVFGVNLWFELDKFDTSDSADDFGGSFFEFTSNADNTSGTWSLIEDFAFPQGASVAVVLKGATNNIAYLLDTAFTSGVWKNDDIPANGRGRNGAPGLSNITFFTTAPPLSNISVPLPAALPLFGSAMGVLGFIGWRRNRHAV